MDCVSARIVSISVKMILHRLVDVDLATVLTVTVTALVCIFVYVHVYICIYVRIFIQFHLRQRIHVGFNTEVETKVVMTRHQSLLYDGRAKRKATRGWKRLLLLSDFVENKSYIELKRKSDDKITRIRRM